MRKKIDKNGDPRRLEGRRPQRYRGVGRGEEARDEHASKKSQEARFFAGRPQLQIRGLSRL